MPFFNEASTGPNRNASLSSQGSRAVIQALHAVSKALVKVDLAANRAAGHPTSTAVIVTNSDDLPEMKRCV